MKVTINVWKDKDGTLQPSRFVSRTTPTFLDGNRLKARINVHRDMVDVALKEAGK